MIGDLVILYKRERSRESEEKWEGGIARESVISNGLNGNYYRSIAQGYIKNYILQYVKKCAYIDNIATKNHGPTYVIC